MKRPKILYIAWGFPPMSGGGTYRTLASANLLDEGGFEVHVLTSDRQGFLGLTAVDDSLVEAIRPGETVHRLPFHDDLRDHDIRHWPPARIADPKGWKDEAVQRREAGFPERTYGFWHGPLIERAEELQATHHFDMVMGSANPHVVMAPVDHLARRFGVPGVIDHRDAWRLNCYSGLEQHTHDPRVAELEAQYFASASQIWFVNRAILEWHQERYPAEGHKMRVVENGFDAAFAPEPATRNTDPDKPLTFSFVGSISPSIPLTEFIDAWLLARSSSAEIRNARADLYGPLAGAPQGRDSLLRDAEQFGIFHHGSVHKADVAGIYESSDALLLILGGGRFVTSGKVYEYLVSALPIVSVHDPANGAREVLQDYPLWFQAPDLSPSAIADALVAAAHAARNSSAETRALARKHGLANERHAQLRQPVQELLDLATTR